MSTLEKVGLSIEEAVSYLGIARASLYRLMDTGAISSFYIGRRQLLLKPNWTALSRPRWRQKTVESASQAMNAGDTTSALEHVLRHLSRVRQVGDGYKAECPTHDDREPSLSIRRAQDGTVLLKCLAGCLTSEVVKAAGLEMKDLFPASSRLSRPHAQEQTWAIREGTGNLAAVHHRRDAGGRKKFWWTLPDGSMGLGGQKVAELPLYRTDHAAGRPSEALVVVEGEKASEALAQLGVLALGTVTGASGTPGRLALQPLAGREVFLWPDNDDPGRNHMDRVAGGLAAFGVAPRIITWPDAPPKGDAADFAVAGGTRECLETLLGAAVPWAPPSRNGAEPDGSSTSSDEMEAHLTDIGNGRRLVARHGQDILYCHPFKQWLVWDGTRWTEDNTGRLVAWAKDTVYAIYTEASTLASEAAEAERRYDKNHAHKLKERVDTLWTHARRSEQAPRIAAMVDLAKSEPGIPVLPGELDADPWVLNCVNGTIDLRTGDLRPHRWQNLITKLAPVSFDPNARLELWDRFLAEALPDAETRSYVQRCVGATIVGLADDDLFLVCHGPGGSGKGTFLGAIQATLGDYAASADLETFTSRRDSHGPQPDLARLRGRRMVAISEVETGGTVALLKRATGGDPIPTRSHHQETFELIPWFTVWVITNDRPRIPDTDSGMWRRVREIPFVVKFENPDPTIRSMLRDMEVAGPSVLARAVQGCLEYQREGVGQLPRLVQQAIANYRAEMDPLADFLEDCAVEVPGAWTEVGHLRKEYTWWNDANGIPKAQRIGPKQFSQRLRDRYQEERRTVARKTARGFWGVAMVTDSDGASQYALDRLENAAPSYNHDTSEMSSTANVPVDLHNDSSHEGQPKDQVSFLI